MVFIDRFGIVDSSVYLWSIVLSKTHYRLCDEEDEGDQTKFAMNGREMVGAVGEFVVLNDDQTSYE